MISDQPDPTGPNVEGLRRLFDALPSMVKGLKTGKIGGKGVPVGKPKPRKICSICGRLHDLASPKVGDDPEALPKPENCKDCLEQLALGYTAIVCVSPNPTVPHRHAFIKAASLADKAGEVILVRPETMDKLQKRFQDEWKTDEPAH